jgi:hypothetical protein
MIVDERQSNPSMLGRSRQALDGLARTRGQSVRVLFFQYGAGTVKRALSPSVAYSDKTPKEHSFMTNSTSVNPTVFHPRLPSLGSRPMGGPSGVGSGPTLNTIVETRNRKERRAQEQQATKARPTQMGRDRLTKEEAHQQRVRHIKKDLEKKGVTLPAQADTSEPASDSFASWGVQALQAGADTVFQTLRNAIQWTPGPQVVGADSTCDVNGQCNGEAAIDIPPISIADFRKLARAAGFSMTMSDSLKTREDKTLRGVVVLIGERDHDSSDYYFNRDSASTRLVQGGIRRSDLLLVEHPPIEGWRGACKGVLDLGAKCYPVDVSEARAELDETEDEMKRAMARVIRAAIEVVDQGGQRTSSVEEMAQLDSAVLEELMLDSMKDLLAAGGESLFSPGGWGQFKQLHETYTAAAKKLEVKIVETTPAREEGFGGELERHSAAAPDRAIFGVFGDHHVQDMEAWVLGRWDAIVLHPKHE